MDTHQNQLLGAIATVFDDGEPYVQSLMADIVWAGIVGSPLVPCPVRYSDRERQQQKEEFVKWERDIDLKQQVVKEVGAYTSWDGAVSPREYDEIYKGFGIARTFGGRHCLYGCTRGSGCKKGLIYLTVLEKTALTYR
jgi:hypothetical protein